MKHLLILITLGLFASCNANDQSTPIEIIMNQENIINLVKNNNLSEVKKALESGMDVNTKDKENRNLLLIATINKLEDMSKLLVENGADVNMQANNLDSAFLLAGASGQTNLVKLFLANGARFDIYNRYNGTALIPASERGHVETVRVLVTTQNFPINHVNRLGWTALMEAVILGNGSRKYQDIVQLLKDNGANLNIADFDGITPLQHAKRLGYKEIVNILSK